MSEEIKEVVAEEIKGVPDSRTIGALSRGAKLEKTTAIGINLPDDKQVVMTPTAMVFAPTCSYNTWKSKGTQMANVIQTFNGHLRWWVGDWIIYGEQIWPDMYSQALEECFYSYGSLRNCVYVCRKIARERRRETLSFEHHYQVCPFNEEDQEKWLTLADQNHWTVAEMRRAIAGREIQSKMEVFDHGVNLSKPDKYKYDRRAINVNLKWQDWENFYEENMEKISTMAVKEAAEWSFKQARER